MPEDDDPTSAIGRGWKSTFLANDRGDVYTIIVYNHHQHHHHHHRHQLI
jgi:hypothetical protein